ncbi:hypothetical protein HZA71_01355 [Candidatus Falkowbacteria bacterium]|nr:hypothetical protein [Candidatus Falkowbacteria bacterium]
MPLEKFSNSEQNPLDKAQAEELEQQQPIFSGEIFDATQKLKEIKELPKEQWRDELEKYKEKLVYQQEGLAKMQVVLTEMAMANPDAPEDMLFKVVDDFRDCYGLTPEQIKKTHLILNAYKKQRETISNFRKEHPENVDLFKTVFGREPKGKLEIIEGPITLDFRCYDSRDYKLILSGKEENYQQKIMNLLPAFVRDIFISERGRQKEDAPIPVLSNGLILEYARGETEERVESTRRHEEQHAVNHFFKKKFEEEAFLDGLLKETDSGNQTGNIIGYYRENIEEYLKDEIISFLKSGESPRQIKTIMRNYIAHAIEPLKKSFQDDLKRLEQILQGQRDGALPQLQSAFKEARKHFGNEEYAKGLFSLVCDGVDCYVSLESERKNEEETYALLINTPLRNWKSLLHRLNIKKRYAL